jgi:hypothetical protein
MIDGTQQYFAQQASLTIGGATYTPAQIVQIFTDRIASNKAAEAATAAKAAAIKADRDKRAAFASVVKAYRRMLEGMFSDSPDTLAAFGLAPIKVASKTVAVKSDAIAKSLATREARHTMGPKQKANIHGTPASPSSPSNAENSPTAPATPVTPATTAGPSPAAPQSR